MNNFKLLLIFTFCSLYQLAWSQQQDLDLVIIGAGVSSLAAATKLLQNNFTNFLILEGSDRIGGRINTIPFGGAFVDLGAEWVHGKTNNPSFDLAAPLGLLYTSNDYSGIEIYIRSNGENLSSELLEITDELFSFTFGSNSSNRINETIKATGGKSDSLGDFVTSLYWKKVDTLIAAKKVTKKEAEDYLSQLEKKFNSNEGSASWFDASLFGEYEFVDEEHDFMTIWKPGFGYSTVIDLLLKKIPNPADKIPVEEKILLNKEAVKVDWSGEKVRILTADGSQFTAKRVLITVSLAVLKERASSLFVPSLPTSKLNAIEGLGINVMNKIYLEFPYHWLPSGVNGINMIWDENDKALVPPKYNWTTGVFGFFKTDRLPLNVLCGWIGGLDARAMELATDEEVIEQSMVLLRKFAPKNTVVPNPIAMRRSQWSSNRFIRGSWSFRHVLADKLNVSPKDLGEPIANSNSQQVLLFAGEATDEDSYGAVHGAIKAGWREADRILRLQ